MSQVGVFDSGIGGLTVLRALQAKMPEASFFYYGDHANAPYGDKAPEQIHEFTRAAVRRLFDLGCDLVILACNTASAVALHDLQVDWLPKHDEGRQRRVLGVFVPIIEAMTRRDWGDNTPPTHTGLANVLLFATPATVASGAFARELKFRARDVVVEAVACTELVDLIEKGDADGVERAVKGYVSEGLSRLPKPQTAALACTHYPIAREAFADALPESTTIFSQGDIVADALGDYIQRYPRFETTGSVTHYFTSGDPAIVSTEATRLIGRNIQFESINKDE